MDKFKRKAREGRKGGLDEASKAFRFEKPLEAGGPAKEVGR